MFYPIYCLRRIIFIGLCVHFQEKAPIQLVIILLTNMFLLIYIGYFKPLSIRLQYRLEMFNEYMICTITPLVVPFANEYYTQETKV